MQPTSAELLSAAYPHPTRQASVRETHLSLVVLTGDYAYKIKKALRLDFIDAASLARRRELCQEEVRLNRRYAPDLYLDVVPIVRTAAGLSFGAAGEPMEYAVRMRQFDPAEELHALLAARGVQAPELQTFAVRLAHTHRVAAISAAPPPRRTVDFQRIVRANVASIERSAELIRADDQARALTRWLEQALAEHAPQLEKREREGRVRECHGDLHTRNVVRWRGELMAFDCIEFDPALRFVDTLSDAAFLVMDLMHLGRDELAFAFLNAYLEPDGDYSALELLRLYLVHLALVRARVDLIEASQHADSPDPRERAVKRLATAERLARDAAPLLIVMHGAAGSGKSWLSERLAPALGAVRVRSDVERKRLAGVDPLSARAAAIDQGLYTPEMNERTYARLAECARACVRGGLHAIVDAAFLEPEQRRRFERLAEAESASFLIVSCSADRATLSARIQARRTQGADPSDATQAVLDRQLRRMQPLTAAERLHAVQADTSADDVVDAVLRALASRARPSA
jgi:aminoglycoside phosphotransferase family enzyme/predicted kinase